MLVHAPPPPHVHMPEDNVGCSASGAVHLAF